MAAKTHPANQFNWQVRAHKVLGSMITHGVKRDFPPLMWTLADTGALIGEAIGLASTPAKQRVAVETWALYLQATVKERVDRDGVRHLVAVWKSATDDQVGGCIRATIYPELDDEGGA